MSPLLVWEHFHLWGFCIQCCVLFYFQHQHLGSVKDPIKGGRAEFLRATPPSTLPHFKPQPKVSPHLMVTFSEMMALAKWFISLILTSSRRQLPTVGRISSFKWACYKNNEEGFYEMKLPPQHDLSSLYPNPLDCRNQLWNQTEDCCCSLACFDGNAVENVLWYNFNLVLKECYRKPVK